MALTRVRVASWNVLFGEMGKPREVGEALKQYDLDIIAFCEVPAGSWTAEAGEALGMKHCYVGATSSANHKDKYKSILSRTPLSGTGETEPEGVGWWPRTLVRAETVVRGVPITVYSLHVPGSAHKSDVIAPHPSGSCAGHIALKVVPAEKGELVMMGDWNDRLGCDNMNLLEQAGMRSTWLDLQIDLSDKFTYSAKGLGQVHAGVIDHICYRTGNGARAVDGGIIELDPPLSDHKPIWAEILFETRS